MASKTVIISTILIAAASAASIAVLNKIDEKQKEKAWEKKERALEEAKKKKQEEERIDYINFNFNCDYNNLSDYEKSLADDWYKKSKADRDCKEYNEDLWRESSKAYEKFYRTMKINHKGWSLF